MLDPLFDSCEQPLCLLFRRERGCGGFDNLPASPGEIPAESEHIFSRGVRTSHPQPAWFTHDYTIRQNRVICSVCVESEIVQLQFPCSAVSPDKRGEPTLTWFGTSDEECGLGLSQMDKAETTRARDLRSGPDPSRGDRQGQSQCACDDHRRTETDSYACDDSFHLLGPTSCSPDQ